MRTTTLKKTPTYVSRRTPRTKQDEALSWVRRREAAALLMGMRTGKTKVVADDVGQMMTAGQCFDLLVVAPGGVYLQWAEELVKDWPAELVARTKFFNWSSDLRENYSYRGALEDFLDNYGTGDYRAFFINTEALSVVQDARRAARSFLAAGESMLVVDESVVIGNKDSILTKFLLGYSRGGAWHEGLTDLADYRRILSGLPSPRSPLQLWSQFKFLRTNPETFPEPFHQFRDRYCNITHLCKLPQKIIERKFEHVFQLRALAKKTDGEVQQYARWIWPGEDPSGIPRPFLQSTVQNSVHMLKRQELVEAIFRAGRWIEAAPVLDKEEPFRNLEELEARIRPHSFRVRLEDCYDMPESDYSFRDVELTPEQRRIYDEMLEQSMAKLNHLDEEGVGDYVSATTAVAQIVRLHQVLCGHTVDENGTDHTIPELRTAALIDLLKDYDGKFIVWCSYDADVRKVARAIEDEICPVARFWGGNVKTREMEERSFKTNPEVRGMVGTPDAGGRGRDWSVADLVVYYSNRNDLDKRGQSEDRPKAVGKTRPIAYVDLRARGTVDEAVIYALRKKIDLVSVIQAEGWRKWLV